MTVDEVTIASVAAKGNGLDEIEGVIQTPGKKRPGYRRRKSEGPATAEKAVKSLPVRRLKTFDPDEVMSFTRKKGETGVGGFKKPGRRGLKPKDSEDSDKGKTSPPAPAGALRAYTDQEREDLAVQHLENALRHSKDKEFVDVRRKRRIGADVRFDVKKYFEIKSSGRETPDRVSLTPTEVERARLEGKDFYLAVISGLEEGFDVEIRIFSDPLHSLDWSPRSNFEFSGVTRGEALVLTTKRVTSGS